MTGWGKPGSIQNFGEETS